MGEPRLVSLFDVDEVTDFGRVRDMQIHPAALPDVVEFCERWHYSGTGGALQWMYGAYVGPVLVGVVAYNPPTITAAACVFGDELRGTVLHMGRLVCAEDAPRNTESHLIAGSLRALSAAVPSARAVLTYAAADQGHIGTVYQATNAIYTGRSVVKDYYLDDLGRRWPTYRDGRTLQPLPGWARRRGVPKYRYVYLIGSKRQRRESLALLKLPQLPYPKVDPIPVIV